MNCSYEEDKHADFLGDEEYFSYSHCSDYSPVFSTMPFFCAGAEEAFTQSVSRSKFSRKFSKCTQTDHLLVQIQLLKHKADVIKIYRNVKKIHCLKYRSTKISNSYVNLQIFLFLHFSVNQV